MDKGLLKTIILGASLIISVLIYSETNKYDSYPFEREGSLIYSVLNKRTGDVKVYSINKGAYIWKSSFDTDKVERFITKDFKEAKD